MRLSLLFVFPSFVGLKCTLYSPHPQIPAPSRMSMTESARSGAALKKRDEKGRKEKRRRLHGYDRVFLIGFFFFSILEVL